MFAAARIVKVKSPFFRGLQRPFSSDTASAPVAKRGAGLLQRLSSFVVGAGVTALVSQFYIYKELQEGNEVLIRKQSALEKRIAKLEGN